MNKTCIAAILLVYNAVAYHSGPSNNEYACGPVTPGYGISGYFELMPEKINPNKSVIPVEHVSQKVIKTAVVSGTMLRLELQKRIGPEPLRISIYTVSGKRLFAFLISEQQSKGTMLSLPIQTISKGVYLIVIATKTDNYSTKLFYIGQ